MIAKPCTEMVVHSCSVGIGRTQYDARLNVEHTISQNLSSKLLIFSCVNCQIVVDILYVYDV